MSADGEGIDPRSPAFVRVPLVVIVGPTAAGKTALSVQLAAALNGEIISADSRQIYRGMDIGAAKVTAAERTGVPHHLLDIVDPDRALTLAEYQGMAYAVIDALHARGRVPFLVGGAGQYVHAVVEGWGIPKVAPHPELRAELAAEAETEGAEALHARLAALDPAAAARIDHRNVRRVIRALEVCLVSGQPISELQRKTPPPYRILQIGVTRPRPELYARIDARINRMIADGLVAEVERLVAAGYDWQLPAMSGLGYRQIGQHLRGEIGLDDAVALIKQQTRRFVQQQYTWFRLDDPAIYWVDPGVMPFETVLAMVRDFLGETSIQASGLLR
ncbi:MAG: tRNA (adenosine(37)-N6)-dimethylallyltransferase MiaA [Chloroflexi bacterium HGW-Chloroflexi-1]|nr:MAG: tRNA (adenosine(37)-N6)-dimethylallyltransferase MiaA [Chloroflexi bacterium HGW-Chloroflexi-1]